MDLIDLHIHSTVSDGTYTPEQIATYAKSKRLFAIALTDHDSIGGVKACQDMGRQLGLKVISGIELSATYEHFEIHILGYNIDISEPFFLERLNEIEHNRNLRNSVILERLNALNLDISFSDLNPTNHLNPIFTRAHFANALLEKGYVRYRKEAFDRYLGYGKPAYVAKDHLAAKDCIDLIHRAGGVAVLAHPTLYKLNKVRMLNLIGQLIPLGLDGVECIYPSFTPRQSKDFIQLCKKYNLICTGGSDFHGDNKPNLDLGTGYGTLQVPSTFLDALL